MKKKTKNKGIDIKQIYGHGSQRGRMPGVSVPAGCRQQASAFASRGCHVKAGSNTSTVALRVIGGD
jgi:hypothetical protein